MIGVDSALKLPASKAAVGSAGVMVIGVFSRSISADATRKLTLLQDVQSGLGEDDMVEGVSQLASFFAEAKD